MPDIRLDGIVRDYGGAAPAPALRGVSVTIRQGEFIAIEGPSGGGKSTLLNVIGLLDSATSGSYTLGSTDVSSLSAEQSARARSDTISFIFQNFHLLDRRPVTDSVELGLLYRGLPPRQRRERASAALAAVGLQGLEFQTANTLSGGQRQRVAIARALASGAPVVVADEPTGNLDTENSELVLSSLRRIHEAGSTVIMVTHSPALAERADRRFHLLDGHLTETTLTPQLVEQPHKEIPHVPGRSSTTPLKETATDAIRSLLSRMGRTVALIAAVGLGVGLAIATAGISLSASAQVSDTFNAHLNRDVTVAWHPGALDDQAATVRSSILSRLGTIHGVDAVGRLDGYDSQSVRVNLVRPTFDLAVYGATPGVPTAARMKITWARGHLHRLGSNEVLVGGSLIDQMSIGPLNLRPTVDINDATFTVVGEITDSPRLPQILGSVVVSSHDDANFGKMTSTQAMLLTKAGAAQQVARQAPLVVDPYEPKSLVVTAPTDPSTLRQQVEGSVQVSLIVVTAVALLGSIAGLANAMTLAVAERKQEIGLRRALGALPRHIAQLIFVESAIVGVLGGLAGLALGLVAILVTTISQHWIPVFDLRLAPAAVLGGIIVGGLGGIVASARASTVLPTEALRL